MSLTHPGTIPRYKRLWTLGKNIRVQKILVKPSATPARDAVLTRSPPLPPLDKDILSRTSSAASIAAMMLMSMHLGSHFLASISSFHPHYSTIIAIPTFPQIKMDLDHIYGKNSSHNKKKKPFSTTKKKEKGIPPPATKKERKGKHPPVTKKHLFQSPKKKKKNLPPTKK